MIRPSLKVTSICLFSTHINVHLDMSYIIPDIRLIAAISMDQSFLLVIPGQEIPHNLLSESAVLHRHYKIFLIISSLRNYCYAAPLIQG
jgi:hypothetical protein